MSHTNGCQEFSRKEISRKVAKAQRRKLKIREGTDWNYHYFPVIFDCEEQLLQVVQALNDKQIFPRRYFYPSLNTLNYVNQDRMPISESISSRVLCLPNYVGLARKDVELITGIIKNTI